MIILQEQCFGLNDDHLVNVNDSHQLMAEVADQYKRMQDAAANEGHDLQICSSYRSFDKQLSIWNRKWEGMLPLNTLDGNQLEASKLSSEEKIHAIMLWSALPGASRHHWGTDFDVYDKSKVARYTQDGNRRFELIPEEYEGQGPCAALASWLCDNAPKYNFSFPYATYTGGVAKEPWHLSYSPIANKIIDMLKLESLAALLQGAEINGKSTILPRLPTLFKRYTLNEGTNK
ncbi:M15 family metallopeptidase [Agaribacter flavus]|uniref:M15 family metallopeptidase n=1 Tax=Agaribacter flavus TaxID=1902781 RepID=A0ABV7FR72_9ALTE